MILLDIKNYIKQHHQVTLMDIRNHFDLTEEAALGLVEPLIKQGAIQQIEKAGCGSGQCSTDCHLPEQGPRYQWLGKKRLKKLAIPVEVN